MTDNTNLIRTVEVARRLRVDPSTIRRRVKRGELTPAQVTPGYNGDLLFDESYVATLEAAS